MDKLGFATFPALGFMGELGNQMFQIASVIGYAKKYGKEVRFPEWTCKISRRDYRHVFRNPLKIYSTQELQPIHGVFNYDGLTYTNLENFEGNVSFQGYFQSEKYFKHCEDDIREIFEPNDEVLKYITEKYHDVLAVKNKVSIQVRTGQRKSNDYDVHAYASIEFIEECQSYFPETELFVVFADNMELAKTMLPPGKNYYLVENEANYIDLFFMTMFDSYIVSPSTFGWWGAWLSNNREAKVVTMKNWFATGKSKEHLNFNNDQIPERWIKI